MRAGGGRTKGAAFERVVGTQLSLWLSNGERADLLMRNILSGGRFTAINKVGGKEHGIPGDLMASHPDAFNFLRKFMVECKHVRDLGIDRFLFDYDKTSFLLKVFALAQRQAEVAGCRPIIVAKQNHRPAIMLMNAQYGRLALALSRPRGAFRYHLFHNESLLMTTLHDLTHLVPAAQFVRQAMELTD